MRRLLLSTTALMALAIPAVAADLGVPPSGSPLYSSAPMVSGDMSAALGGAWASGEGESQSLGAYDTSARFALPLVSGISFEGELIDAGVFQDGASLNNFLGLAHFYTQSPGYAVGVFGGAGSAYFASLWQAGLEAQAYWGNFTGEGSIAYTSLYKGHASLWTGRLGGRYYFTPDTKLSLGVDYVSLDGMGSGSNDAWGVDGGLEHRFSGTPWSGFVKAAYLDASGAHVTTALAGIRVSLDAPGSTLQSHDRLVPWQSNLGILGFAGF